MKIALVVPGFSANENDWCIPAHTDIVRALAKIHEVHVYALRYPPRVDTYGIGKATVHSFGGAHARGVNTARLWFRVQQEMTREHARGAFDVVHAIFGGEAGSVAVLCAKRLRVPSVVWLVNGELTGIRQIGYGADLNPRLRWMNKFVLRYANEILCGCDALTESARARVSAPRRAHIQTLPLGVDTTRFFSAPQLSSSQVATIEFVNVGSLLPVKAQNTLLRALAQVVETMPNVHLTIAGAGPLEKHLRALASALRLESRVTFAGHAPHDQLPAVYRNAQVFVQSSLHEGQGMALLEAAACGCAVCGTDVGALRDLARGGGAVTCAVGDADALARAMETAARAHFGLGARARERVASEYALEHITRRLNHLYAQIAARAEQKTA